LKFNKPFKLTFLLSYGDAKGLTLIFQRVKTYELLGRGSLILALYALDILTLYSFLSVTLITAVVSNGTLLREVKILDNFSIIDRRYRVIIGKILDYSLPLAVVELISIFYNMGDIFLIESKWLGVPLEGVPWPKDYFITSIIKGFN